jgi:hypothetical protein
VSDEEGQEEAAPHHAPPATIPQLELIALEAILETEQQILEQLGSMADQQAACCAQELALLTSIDASLSSIAASQVAILQILQSEENPIPGPAVAATVAWRTPQDKPEGI